MNGGEGGGGDGDGGGHECHKNKNENHGLCFKACHFVIQSCVLFDCATYTPKFNKMKICNPNLSKLDTITTMTFNHLSTC